jgi:regulator of RNase E activity RraA
MESSGITTPDIERPPQDLIDKLTDIGSATASGELAKLGVRSAHIAGPLARTDGASIVGPAITLQFLPKREDLYKPGEYVDREKQLHRHALYHTQPGDVVVVDARGDLESGVFGDMMLTFFKGRGGAGVIVDGCIRDYPKVKHLDLPRWTRGFTPNFHTQTNIWPTGVNCPIGCGGTLIIPGDIIIADDDGAVVVPIDLAPELAEKAGEHAEWEVFSRERLSEGGDLRKYYPLTDEARIEYEEWKKQQ